MTRRDQTHKWFVYALALIPVWLLDEFVLNRIPLFGVIPMLLPLAVVAVAVLEGSVAGAGFGMAVGILWELAYPGGFGGLHGPGDGLPLGLGGVHKGLVALGEGVRLLQLPGPRLGSAVGAVVEELLGQSLGVNFFVFLGHFQILQSLNFA